MILSQINKLSFDRAIRSQGVSIQIGPYKVNIASKIPGVSQDVSRLYDIYDAEIDSKFSDIYIQIERGSFFIDRQFLITMAPNRLRPYH